MAPKRHGTSLHSAGVAEVVQQIGSEWGKVRHIQRTTGPIRRGSHGSGMGRDGREPEPLGQRPDRPALQALEKCFDPGDDPHRREMLIHLDVQIGLFSHLLPEQVGECGVRPAAVVGEIHSVQVWVMGHQFGPGQDVLAEGPVQIGVIRRQVQVVGGQMGQGEDLVPPLQQQPGDAHIQNRVREAVVPGDEHQHLVLRPQGGQQVPPLFLHCGGVPPYSLGAGHQGGKAAHLGNAQLFPKAQHGGCHGLLAKIQVKYRIEQGNAPLLQPERPGGQPGCGLHIYAAVVVLHS